MSDCITLKGMILETHPYGEADKRIVILTGERGRVTAFARGARRPKSVFAASTEPFVFGEFELYPGKSAYSLEKVNVKEYFREISTDIDKAALGFYFLELAGYYAVEESEERDLTNLLYMGIKAILTPGLNTGYIRRAFEFRAMVVFGEYPDMLEDTRPAPFDLLSGNALNVMRFIQTAGLKELFAVLPEEGVMCEIDKAMDIYINAHRHHVFKSLELLNSMW